MALLTSPTSSMSVTALRENRGAVKTTTYRRKKQPPRRVQAVFGNFNHFGDVVRRDMEFLKKGVKRGVDWASETFRISQAKKAVDDVVWLRNLEDPNFSPPPQPPLWPQPYYPELSGLDLMMADLKALEVYASYFYYQAKKWSKPLPEVYDAEEVADYFSLRPHVVAFRLLEVLSSFASAAIRIRMTGVKKFSISSPAKDIDENSSQYNFGMVLKETLLVLGPTFIKGQKCGLVEV
ncbi:uncharacterized protein LOC120213258 isoform X2 [Hibiscus syriacus]|uniref:uncharacterized protein LOC120213258 isoform X2 n=1 Tax=Hibiscus syriacus TaxID=106335 RepID=UPI00192482DE|nr:uncharacterized protein LOC120213258 isoform X2 [Hibiscus syriacus]